jgi:hypothetical protein
MSDTALRGGAKLRRTKAGDTYGRWTVIEADMAASTSKHLKWRCRCACGVERSVWGDALRSAASTSCGCYNRERVSEVTSARNFKHGLSTTPEYASWQHMVNRCQNPKTDCFENYGGRGITVCDRWATSFENFRADMGPRPSLAHTLDRIDNEKGYSPDNCRWATRRVQLCNRRNARLVSIGGETKTITEWAESLGISRNTLTYRLDVMRLTPVEALGVTA